MPPSNILKISRAALLAEARSWVGTPWVDHGHVKGVGVDCVGLIVETLKHLGFMPDFVYPTYSRTAKDDGELERHVGARLTPIDIAAIQPGDIVVTRAQHISLPTHLAFIGNYAFPKETPLSLIHAAIGLGNLRRRGLGSVVEHVLDETWRKNITHAYSVPGAD